VHHGDHDRFPVPDPMKDWVEAQIQTGAYASSSDLRKLIDEAEASGISSRGLDEIFAEARAIAKSRGIRQDAK
jgi:antitoxin ParD1/3/4